jgi:hypothetical protein
MNNRLAELFEDQTLGERISSKLPHLFNIAELESSRAGKNGKENVRSNLPSLLCKVSMKLNEMRTMMKR